MFYFHVVSLLSEIVKSFKNIAPIGDNSFLYEYTCRVEPPPPPPRYLDFG